MFTNSWWAEIASNYTVMIGIISGVICFIVKFLAIIDPKIPSERIIDLFKSYWPGIRKTLPTTTGGPDEELRLPPETDSK
jgi:uncharacterized protein (UPF0216 family)